MTLRFEWCLTALLCKLEVLQVAVCAEGVLAQLPEIAMQAGSPPHPLALPQSQTKHVKWCCRRLVQQVGLVLQQQQFWGGAGAFQQEPGSLACTQPQAQFRPAALHPPHQAVQVHKYSTFASGDKFVNSMLASTSVGKQSKGLLMPACPILTFAACVDEYH